ncbi:MAG: sugar kinase [Opitutus sp.]|nr:sugar kinase [Opitutus sp.]
MKQKDIVLCFGEALGLFLNPSGTRLRDCARADVSFAGAESNVAIGLARLGCPVAWLSAVGADPVGDRIVRQLRAEGVGVHGVKVDASRPTALMLRDRVGWNEPSVYYWRDTSAFNHAAGDLVEALDWTGVGAIFFSGITPGLNERTRAATLALVAAARKRGVKLWFDVNFRHKLWNTREAAAFIGSLVPQLDVLFTSIAEGQFLTGRKTPGDIAGALLERGAQQVVVKLGSRGAHWFSGREDIFCPAFPISAEVDPIGAGDGFDAGFLSGVLAGKATAECLRRGAACGALVCLTDGDWEGLPTLAEIERFAAQVRQADR